MEESRKLLNDDLAEKNYKAIGEKIGLMKKLAGNREDSI
jgi:hypothetical protein